jgi:hypothetical protein
MFNQSGMHRVAQSIVEAEKKLGIDSHLINLHDPPSFEHVLDADVHVSHTHFPEELRKKVTKPLKLVWVGHGTPEHVFQGSVEEGNTKRYGHGDGWMLVQHWLQTADALVTFWPRHQAVWKSLCDKATQVHCVPLGVDKEFWKPMESKGRFSGCPSVMTSENAHYIKWPLDLFITWPWVYPHVNGNAVLHAPYLPTDQHRWFFPLVNRNGTSYAAHISPLAFTSEDLRNALCSINYYCGLVRYGDFNRMSLEANACGAKTISWRGNPYSDFWLTEGDQREMAAEMVKILNNEVEPRAKTPVPDISETAVGMIEVYNSIL